MGDHQQPEGMRVEGNLELPPGFRFHPTDEEIITFYLTPKVLQRGFTCIAIGDANLNRTEPWELPGTYAIQSLYIYTPCLVQSWLHACEF
jgi:hypothetical protein